MNEEVTAPDLRSFCQELNLVEAISMMHGRSPLLTHQRGSKAIDGIYLSRQLLIGARGGFLAFGEVMSSDHRAVWIDIQAANVGMTQQETVVRPVGRRLKCQDPRIVVKYTKALAQDIDDRGWASQVKTLYTMAETSGWSAQHSNQYNELDKELTQAKLRAEQHCRKLSAGHIPWTPALTQAIQQIQYWKGIAKRAFGGKISTTVLKRQAAMGQLSFSNKHWELPTSTINQTIKSAYDNYYTIKAQKNRRDTWIGQMIEAISSAKDIPKARLWKQI